MDDRAKSVHALLRRHLRHTALFEPGDPVATCESYAVISPKLSTMCALNPLIDGTRVGVSEAEFDRENLKATAWEDARSGVLISILLHNSQTSGCTCRDSLHVA